MIVVSDTTPINYLIQIEQLDLIRSLFGTAFIPSAVHAELLHPGAPVQVRTWAAAIPVWVTVAEASPINDRELFTLDRGERQAIALAELLPADFLLTDDYRARIVARGRGLATLTTLLILDAAADRGWLSFKDSVELLLKTNFRVDRFTIEQLLAKHV